MIAKALVSGILLLLGAAAANAYTASEMRESCRQVVLSDAGETFEGGRQTIMIPPTFDAGVCWGGFAAFQDIIMFVTIGEEYPMLGVCPPVQTTRRHLVEVFYMFTTSHPEREDEEWTVVTMEALREAFPC